MPSVPLSADQKHKVLFDEAMKYASAYKLLKQCVTDTLDLLEMNYITTARAKLFEGRALAEMELKK